MLGKGTHTHTQFRDIVIMSLLSKLYIAARETLSLLCSSGAAHSTHCNYQSHPDIHIRPFRGRDVQAP